MHMFDQEVAEKKRIARGARNRVVGSRTRFVLLNQYTDAQLKQKAGKVTMYNIKKRVNYKEFRFWPEDLQRQYIEGLQDRFKISGKDLSEMLGISIQTTYNLYKKLGFKDSRCDRKPTDQEKLNWSKFLAGEPIEESTSSIPEETSDVSATLLSGSLQYEGDITIALKAAMRMIGNAKGNVSIVWEIKSEE